MPLQRVSPGEPAPDAPRGESAQETSVGRAGLQPLRSKDLLRKPVEQRPPAGERFLGACPTRRAEKVALGQATEPALELVPVSLAFLELREPEPLLAGLAADLVLEALDAVEDLLVLGVAGRIEPGDQFLLPGRARRRRLEQ